MADEQTTATAEEAPQSQPVETAAPESWRDGLSDDLKMNANLLKFNDIEGLAKSYISAQSMIGADKVAIPGKHASPDDWSEVYGKLGRPEAADGYELNYGEGDNPLVGEYAEAVHAAGLNPQQAQSLLDWYTEVETRGNQAQEEAAVQSTEDGLQELRQEWGRAFDQKAASAQRAANALLGGTEMFDEITLADGRKLGDHPTIVKMFASLADQISEDTMQGETTETAFTPDEAMRRIAEITAPTSPYWDKRHPQHMHLVEEALRLREYAHPE